MQSPSPSEAFRRLVSADEYPCIMAKSVLRREQYTLHSYGRMGAAASTAKLAHDLGEFAQQNDADADFRSFLAGFDGPPPATEEAFEEALWQTLRDLHERDEKPWDPAVSSDPADPSFSFSFAARAFYVVGLHPNASRPARRCDVPLLVFNLHDQFEQLREEGRYDKIRSVIRDRDRELAGSENPMMSDFGTESDARQYAGRAVDANWQCPFHADT